MMLRAFALVVAASIGFANFAVADVTYSNTNQTGFRANPGVATTIWFDDATFSAPSLLLNGVNFATALDVKELKFGIRRLANAPATDVSLYLAAMNPSVTTITPSSVKFLGTFNLAANGATAVTHVQTATVAPGTFKIPILYDGFGAANFGYVLGGASLSNVNGANGIRLNNNIAIPFWGSPNGLGTGLGAPNANFFWAYNTLTNTNTFNSFGFTGANAATNPPATFYMEMTGTPVPEPSFGIVSLLGVGIATLVGRRRRR
ncbi:MAG: hypothetical protein ABL888_20140 [Pirellulaceae bacterium]